MAEGGHGEGSWRCADDIWKFCPPEGCPAWYGCARKHGWKLGQPSPPECTGHVVSTSKEKGLSSVK